MRKVDSRSRRAARLILVGILYSTSQLYLAFGQVVDTMPIKDVLVDGDSDFVPDRIGQILTVVGTATTYPREARQGFDYVVIQDNTGGLRLLTEESTTLAGILPGTIVRARGLLLHRRGVEELHIQSLQIEGKSQPPSPRDVLVADLLGERYANQLVRVHGQLVMGSESDGTVRVELGDRSGTIQVRLPPRFARSVAEPRARSRLGTRDDVEIVGIADQSKIGPPFDSGYRLAPRERSDITLPVVPPYRLIFVGVLLLFFAGLAISFWLFGRVSERRVRDRTSDLAKANDLLEEKFLELRRIESELRVSEERYRHLFDNSPMLVWELDMSGILAWMDERKQSGVVDFEAFLNEMDDALAHAKSLLEVGKINQSSMDLLGIEDRSVLTEFPHLSRPESRCMFRDLLEVLWRKEFLFEAEIPAVASDGKALIFEARFAAPIADDCPDYSRMILSAVDVTDQRVAVRSRLELAAILDASTDAIVRFSHDDIVMNWSEGAKKMFGYASVEMVGSSVSCLLPSDRTEEHGSIRSRALAGNETFIPQTVRLRKDGHPLDVSISVFPMKGEMEEVNGYAAIVREITELKHVEEQVRQAQKMEAVGRLAGGIAHDFNNLLTVVSGYANLLLEELPKQGATARKVQTMAKAAERASDLTRQLLAFGRKQVFKARALNLNDTVEELEEILRRLSREDVEVVIDLDEGLGNVAADPTQIEQVVINLAVNARDAMPDGGRLEIETANVDLDESFVDTHVSVIPGSYVRLSVKDKGVGMDEYTKGHLFDPFYTTKEPGDGSGLGLAAVYGTVIQSGGSVWVYSEQGIGTTFNIYLPRIDRVPDVTSRVEAKQEIRGTETILLVEDDDSLRVLTSEVLTTNGYSVIESPGGYEATRASMENKTVDLMLSDVVMPGASGPDLVEELRKDRPELRCLYMSGYSDDELQRRLAKENVALVTKPFRPHELLQAVRAILDGGR